MKYGEMGRRATTVSELRLAQNSRRRTVTVGGVADSLMAAEPERLFGVWTVKGDYGFL